MNGSYKKIFLLSLFICVIMTCLLYFPSDDTLRHVGLSFGNFTSWGNVYPFSTFERFKDYDPWFGYDLTLRLTAGALKSLPVSLLTLKFLLTKILVFLFSLTFFYLVLKRSYIHEEIKNRDTFTLALIILFAFLAYPYVRIMIARPFALGIFFLLYSVGRKGLIRGVLSSLILTFFYPYLSWFYVIPVAFAHFIKGDKKFAIGAISFIMLFLLMQPPSFWGFQIALFKSDFVRNAIMLKIGEFNLTLKYLRFYIVLTVFLILYPRFSDNARRLNYSNLLILIYLLPSLKYNRYFIDFTLPLLFVSFGKEILHILIEPYKKLLSSWTQIIQSGFDRIKSMARRRPAKPVNIKEVKRVKCSVCLKPFIAVLYILLFVLLININIKQLASLKDFRDLLLPVPEGSLVLVDFNLQYKTLYLRPDLHIIPSCEAGFPEADISKDYINFFNEGILTPLAQKTGVKYFLESKLKYINPQEGRFLKLLNKNNELTLWQILDQD